MDIKWVGCAAGNWRTGRYGYKPRAIVIHLMDGSLAGTDAWFNTIPDARNNNGFASSAHYGIGKSGEVHQYVKDEDEAYHAGRVAAPTWKGIIPAVNPNLYTIGIEHEGRATDQGPWPEAQLATSAALIAACAHKWSIPIDREHIVGHREIYAGKSCPGPNVDLDALVARAALIP